MNPQEQTAAYDTALSCLKRLCDEAHAQPASLINALIWDLAPNHQEDRTAFLPRPQKHQPDQTQFAYNIRRPICDPVCRDTADRP